jgi:cytochrome b
MVYAIWGTLGVIIATGISMAGLPPHAVEHHKSGAPAMAASLSGTNSGADSDTDSGSGKEQDEGATEKESPLKDVHETAADVLYIMIALHLACVVFESRRSGRQIVLAMIPGRR